MRSNCTPNTNRNTVRQQIKLTKPLYLTRQKAVAQIPNFWPLVLEQAPPEIDQYIQPSDSGLLLTFLTSLSVTHFEESDLSADPRSVAIRWEFAENEHFENKVLEKKFWYRRTDYGWAGLVSEPVEIKWKSKEKDLTGGLLGLVIECWEEEQTQNLGSNGAKKPNKGITEKQRILKKKIENTGMGGMSFFAWFGFIGRRVTAEQSREATRLENEKVEKRKNGVKAEVSKPETEKEEDDDEDEDLSYELEIFPDGDDIAVAITEDLWPGAIKYFSKSSQIMNLTSTQKYKP